MDVLNQNNRKYDSQFLSYDLLSRSFRKQVVIFIDLSARVLKLSQPK